MARAVATAWGIRRTEPPEPNSTRLPDLAAFALLPIASSPIPTSLPVNEVAAAAIVGLALARQPRGLAAPRPAWFMGLLATMVGFIAVHTLVVLDLPAERRVAHLTVWLGLALTLSAGRIHAPSAARGLGIGLLVATAGFFIGYRGSYGTRLTGFFADPNVAGYYLTAYGFLAIGLAATRRWRLVLLVTILVALFLTFSRTSWLAAGLGVGWMLVAGRLGRAPSIALLALGTWLVSSIPADLQHEGTFADRQGSDQLRERILPLSLLKVDGNPIFGGGAGTATIQLGDATFFFHSSYLAVRQEGGWLSLVLLLAVVVGVIGLSAGMPRSRRLLPVEASLVATCACAVNMGEVFFDLPLAVALGMAMWCVRMGRLLPPDLPALSAPGAMVTGDDLVVAGAP
ncbi:MAG TPA: hypothetical protein P5181_00785 [Dermatophilaceae bacterium]|nr:hypothetical protein [Dermatophilaceae bacterium]